MTPPATDSGVRHGLGYFFDLTLPRYDFSSGSFKISPSPSFKDALILPDGEWEKAAQGEPWDAKKGFVIRFDGEAQEA